MRHKIASDSTTKPDELTEDFIRVRAYQLYEERGCEHGHDLEDWLRAEVEILGEKPAAFEAKDSVGRSRAAAA